MIEHVAPGIEIPVTLTPPLDLESQNFWQAQFKHIDYGMITNIDKIIVIQVTTIIYKHNTLQYMQGIICVKACILWSKRVKLKASIRITILYAQVSKRGQLLPVNTNNIIILQSVVDSYSYNL